MAELSKTGEWLVNDDNTRLTCEACGSALKTGDKAFTCPRCKAVHHFDCWVEKGGCSKHGCSQLADPSLIKDKEPAHDPPTKEAFAWVPVALTISLIILVIGGIVWNVFRGRATQNTITVMVPVDSDVGVIQQVAKEYDEHNTELNVNVLSVPTDDPLYYDQKLVIMLVAREPPEIIYLPYERFLAYASQGALGSLDVIKPSVVSAAPFGKRLNTATIDGKLMGIPHPSKQGFFAIPSLAKHREPAQQLLLQIVKALPFTPGIDDTKKVDTGVKVPSQIAPSTRSK